MTKQFDTLVFILRGQPIHEGHKKVIEKGLENAKEMVIAFGSAFQARSPKNPFTYAERVEMLKRVFPKETGADKFYHRHPRIKIVPIMDYPDDDNAWVSAVQTAVDANRIDGGKVGLIGHAKDHTSFYLKIFPDWKDNIEVGNIDGINATDIREMFYASMAPEPHGYGAPNINWKDKLPTATFNYIMEWKEKNPDVAKWLYDEDVENFKYKRLWKDAPYKPTFVTTDAVLTQSGYILLIRRGKFPFKGYWALPGGYLDMRESIVNNMIKELNEETGVKVPQKVLHGSVKGVKVFDHVDRDPRGRTITHGFHVDLGYPDVGLPKVKGGDDAAEAKWFHLSEIKSDMMAFDHYHIIKHFIPTY